MYVYKGVWMIPVTIALAIISGIVIRAYITSEDTRFVIVVTVLILISIGGLVFRYYDKEETK